MASSPEIALLVSTFQKPRHLELCLLSIAQQRGIEGRLEVVVTDDGSADETPGLVERFARDAPFPLGFTTHPHDGFQLARCRNEGVAVSRAPYLLFLDGDCILPPDHVRVHLEQARTGTANGGEALYLTPEVSRQVDADAVRRGNFDALPPLRERLRVWREHLESELNWLLRHPHKPKLFGGNTALWRRDLERINGFDQRFRHWGGEDDDLRMRLRQAGVAIRSIRHRTCIYHLWHPPDPTKTVRWRDGRNVPYIQRGFRLSRCAAGLTHRRPEDLSIRTRNAGHHTRRIAQWLPFLQQGAAVTESAEIEFLFLPGEQEFTGSAECNVLVLTQEVPRPPLRQAHILVSDQADLPFDPALHFQLEDFQRLWQVL